MSTLQDFLDAPFGATATQEETRARAFRLHREFGETWVVAEMDGTFDVLESEELVDGGFTLDTLPSRGTSSREALDLAWELAHPVNGGDVIPKNLTCLQNNGECIETKSLPTNWTPAFPESVRTLEPLPEPESDWLDAPAVVAWSRWDDVRREKIWSREDRCYKSTDGEVTNWQDLRNVTPLYPKEGQDK